ANPLVLCWRTSVGGGVHAEDFGEVLEGPDRQGERVIISSIEEGCSKMTNDEQLALLKHYAAMGWVIFPLHDLVKEPFSEEWRCSCGNKGRCPGAGKHPRIKWTQLQEPPTPKHLEYWFYQDRAAGWAVHLGPSRLICLDVDPRNGGLESLAKM